MGFIHSSTPNRSKEKPKKQSHFILVDSMSSAALQLLQGLITFERPHLVAVAAEAPLTQEQPLKAGISTLMLPETRAQNAQASQRVNSLSLSGIWVFPPVAPPGSKPHNRPSCVSSSNTAAAWPSFPQSAVAQQPPK